MVAVQMALIYGKPPVPDESDQQNSGASSAASPSRRSYGSAGITMLEAMKMQVPLLWVPLEVRVEDLHLLPPWVRAVFPRGLGIRVDRPDQGSPPAVERLVLRLQVLALGGRSLGRRRRRLGGVRAHRGWRRPRPPSSRRAARRARGRSCGLRRRAALLMRVVALFGGRRLQDHRLHLAPDVRAARLGAPVVAARVSAARGLGALLLDPLSTSRRLRSSRTGSSSTTSRRLRRSSTGPNGAACPTGSSPPRRCALAAGAALIFRGMDVRHVTTSPARSSKSSTRPTSASATRPTRSGPASTS